MGKWIDRHLGNHQDRTAAVTAASSTINAFIGIGKLILGVYLLSMWFITNGIYYLLLCAARGQVLRQYTVSRQIKNYTKRYDKEFAVYKRSGIFICLLGVSYLLVCLRMYFVGAPTVYSGYLVYAVATISFTKMGFAIYGTVITRRLTNPIASTLKIISFTDAMVSIVVTQYTLLTMQTSAQAASSSALFGMGVSASFVIIGILMWMKKDCRRKTAHKLENGTLQ